MVTYGMPLFGLLLPWSPPYVLWVLMAAAIILTLRLSVQRQHWLLALLIVLSGYLAYRGLPSAPLYFLLCGVAQVWLLMQPGRPVRTPAP